MLACSTYWTLPFLSILGCHDRLVWNRIWAVLSDFFVEVGCHRNLQVRQHFLYSKT